MLVWFVYATKSQRATAQSHAATLSRDEVARQNRAKIAGVTSVLERYVYVVCKVAVRAFQCLCCGQQPKAEVLNKLLQY